MKEYKVTIPEEVRDLVQKAGLEYHQKRNVIMGLIEDHQFDDNTAFLDSEIFAAYEKKMAQAQYAFDELKSKIEREYKPKELEGKPVKWNLDYNSCEMTFKVM